MSSDRHVHRLNGCQPVPLASYLKALGVLRLVSEQADASAQGWWNGDVFHIDCRLDTPVLQQFFLELYRPTPLVGPWGARSGFFNSGSEKSARESLDTIQSCRLVRLQDFATAITAVHSVLNDLRARLISNFLPFLQPKVSPILNCGTIIKSKFSSSDG